MQSVNELISLFPELTVLTLVLLIDWFIPFPNKYSPANFFRLLANAFVKKVATSGSDNQQKLAGWLSLFTYLFLLLTILLSILFVVENDVWTHGLLLYLSLGYQTFAVHAKTIQACVTKQQKSVARTLLSQNSPYDSSRLSLLGINKLTLEITTIRFVSLWIMPVILFVIFDGVVAFTYRAVIEAYFAWLPQKPGLRFFGSGITLVKNVLEILPTLLIAPVYSVFKSSPGWSRLISEVKQDWRDSQAASVNTLVWMSIVSAGCKSELAGPLMIDGQKISRPRINRGALINESAIGQLIQWNNRFRTIIILFNLVLIFILALTNK